MQTKEKDLEQILLILALGKTNPSETINFCCLSLPAGGALLQQL